MHDPQALSLWLQRGRRFPSQPLVISTLMEGSHANCTWTSGTLGCPITAVAVDGRPLAGVAHREVECASRDPPLVCWRTPQEVETPMWKMRRLPSQEEGIGSPVDSPHGLLAPSNRGGHRTSYQYPSHWVVTGYSKNKHFQWQCHTRKDRSVFQTVVPQGTMCQGPLPGISGPWKYSQVVEREQWCIWPSTWVLPLLWPIYYRIWLLFLALWHHLMSWCKTFTKLPRVTMRRSLLCHKARSDPQTY